MSERQEVEKALQTLDKLERLATGQVTSSSPREAILARLAAASVPELRTRLQSSLRNYPWFSQANNSASPAQSGILALANQINALAGKK